MCVIIGWNLKRGGCSFDYSAVYRFVQCVSYDIGGGERASNHGSAYIVRKSIGDTRSACAADSRVDER